MDVLNATVNLTSNESIAVNGTKATVDDLQGLVIAYFSLFLMAIIPIYIGAQKSVSRLRDQKKNGDNNVERLSNIDAAKFPLYSSCLLFGLYLIKKDIQAANQVAINYYQCMLLSICVFFPGVLALSNTLNPLIEKYIPDLFQNCVYHLEIKKSMSSSNKDQNSDDSKSKQVTPKSKKGKIDNKKDTKEESSETNELQASGDDKSNKSACECLFKYSYKRKEFLGLSVAVVVGVWYVMTKHWIANNLFGLAFSISFIESMHLNKVITGCILLGGFFIYDIFWVFGTDVMVTVVKSFEAPIKLVFPRDLVMTGFSSSNYAMLGLGDIVIPGIFVSLLLRFDYSQKKGRQTYFYAGYVAYIIGLMTTMIVMHVFKHAQPALLYLVPACLGIPIILSVILGDRVQLFNYEDNPKSEETKSS